MDFTVLTDDNFTLYAMKTYSNPQCKNIEEFHEDMNRIKYLKRLFKKYKSSGILRERLILNHIIIFYNVFNAVPATRLLFNRIEPEFHSYLKTFIVYLNLLPSKIPEIDLVKIPIEMRIANKLREI
jgi:sulfur relay (sulfurtransferase) DsrC/TusE family protein